MPKPRTRFATDSSTTALRNVARLPVLAAQAGALAAAVFWLAELGR